MNTSRRNAYVRILGGIALASAAALALPAVASATLAQPDPQTLAQELLRPTRHPLAASAAGSDAVPDGQEQARRMILAQARVPADPSTMKAAAVARRAHASNDAQHLAQQMILGKGA